MIKELAMQVNGFFGGHIEQSYLYMDPMSAADWCSIADVKDYDDMQASMQLDRAAGSSSKHRQDGPGRGGAPDRQRPQ